MPVTRPICAIVTGNIRRPSELQLTLARLFHWRDQGRIDHVVLSTWHGEIEKVAGLRQALADGGVQLVEDDFPAESGMGHIAYQQRSLWNGLAACPDDALVVKLRTDKVFARLFDRVPAMLELLPLAAAPVAPLGSLPSPFEGRIIVSEGHISAFYIPDIVFCGLKRDLHRLVGFGRQHDGFRFPGSIAAEQRWFSQPFLGIPAIQDYFSVAHLGNLEATYNLLRAGELAPLPLPSVIRRYHLVYFLMFMQSFLTISAPELSGVAADGTPHARDRILSTAVRQLGAALLKGSWAEAYREPALLAEAARIVEGGWREPTLDRRAHDELDAFQRTVRASVEGGPLFGFPTLSPPPPAAPTAAPGTLARGLDAGAPGDALPELLERVGSGAAVDLGRDAYRLARSLWRLGDAASRAAAIEWLTVAANSGHAGARLLLGEAHARGIGTGPDRNTALTWLWHATQDRPRGLWAPRRMIALLEEPETGAAERERFIGLLEKSVNPHAVFLIGRLFEAGAVVAPDPERARRLCEAAAAAGSPAAARRLTEHARRPGPIGALLDWIGARGR